MNISDWLTPSRIVVTSASSKTEAIEQVLALFAQTPAISDSEALAREIFQREEVLPTGIGCGIGVPHVRTRVVRDPVAALGVFPAGVEYGSLDRVPVKLILMIAMPENTHDVYLRYLSRVSMVFADSSFRERVTACPDCQAV